MKVIRQYIASVAIKTGKLNKMQRMKPQAKQWSIYQNSTEKYKHNGRNIEHQSHNKAISRGHEVPPI
jgi:phage terminase small subunit